MAAVVALQAGETAGDAPVLQQRQAGDDAGRDAVHQDSGGPRRKGKGNLGPHDDKRTDAPRLLALHAAQVVGEKHHGGNAHPAADEQGRGAVVPLFEGRTDGTDHAKRIIHLGRRQFFCADAVNLEEDFNPAPLGVGAHDRHGTAHGQVRVATQMNEVAGAGALGDSVRRQTQEALPAGQGLVLQDDRFLDKEGVAGVRKAHGAWFNPLGTPPCRREWCE